MAFLNDARLSLNKYHATIVAFLGWLPAPVTRFIGYRQEPPKPPLVWAAYLWSFVAAFCGIATLIALFGHTKYFSERAVPPIVASFGASAILCYGSIEAPLAQPRALVFGHFFSGLIGVIVAKIFDLSFDGKDYDRQWAAGALSVAVALVVMKATETTHPPAGATALLPCVDDAIWNLHWYFLPVVLLSSATVLATALLFNNIQRHYPKFWISPGPGPKPAPSSATQSQPTEGSVGSQASEISPQKLEAGLGEPILRVMDTAE